LPVLTQSQSVRRTTVLKMMNTNTPTSWAWWEIESISCFVVLWYSMSPLRNMWDHNQTLCTVTSKDRDEDEILLSDGISHTTTWMWNLDMYKYKQKISGFTVVLVKSPVYWNMAPYFREAGCLPLHGSPGTLSREQTILFLE